MDKLVAIIITFFILKTAYDIFIESSFSLSDGFDDRLLEDYQKAIMEIPKISKVKSQRGRTYGSNIYLDITLEMNPDLSVFESHEIADQVESMLEERFGVFDTDVHIEPAPIPEDEILDNVYKKLLMREQLIDQGNQLEELLADDFVYIRQDGEQMDKEAYKAEKEKVVKIREDKKRMTYQEKQEWASIEGDIEALENRITAIEEEMQANGSDFGKLATLQKELDEKNEVLLEKYERYEYLSDFDN